MTALSLLGGLLIAGVWLTLCSRPESILLAGGHAHAPSPALACVGEGSTPPMAASLNSTRETPPWPALGFLVAVPLFAVAGLTYLRRTRSRPHLPQPDKVGAAERATFYRRLIQNSNDAIYLLHNRKFVLINDRFRELFGVTLKDVNRPDFDFLELVAPRSRPVLEERARQLEAGHRAPARYEFTALSRDGREFDVESSVSYVPHEDGIATLGSLRDISHRWVLEQQLLCAGKIEFVECLVSEITHDLSEIATVIGGQAELIAASLPESDSLQKRAREISDNAQKASRLTGRIRALSRPSTITSNRLDLGRQVQEMEHLLRRLLGSRACLLIDHASEPVHVQADPALIEYLLMVLVVTARDRLPSGSVLNLEVRSEIHDSEESGEEAHQVRCPLLSFTVSGPSVRSGDLDRRSRAMAQIFDGIEEAAAAVNGTASLECAPDDREAIYVRFPRLEEESRPQSGLVPDCPGPAGETILIVDDDEGIRHFAEEVLAREGYQVLTAVDGAHAIRVAETADGPIDLLVTDVVMPVLGGTGLRDALRPCNENLRFLFMSGYPKGDLIRTGKIGPEGMLLPKPFTLASLREGVRAALSDG